jgi:hypothetical protein
LRSRARENKDDDLRAIHGDIDDEVSEATDLHG